MLAMANGHDADDAPLAVDGVDDPKAADAEFPQSVEFAQQRRPTPGVGGNCTNGSFDGTFQVRMERPDHLSHMRRDVRTEGIHALRRFLTRVTGSPNTSSKVSPFLPDR